MKTESIASLVDRPRTLIVFLALLFLFNCGLVINNMFVLARDWHSLPEGAVPFLVISVAVWLMRALAVGFAWFLRRVGVLLLGISFLVVPIIGLFFDVRPVDFLLGPIGLLILIVLVRPVWPHFR